MPTIQIELFKTKKLVDGRYPVVIRVTHGSVSRKKIATAFEAGWDDHNKINLDIEEEFTKYEAVFKRLKRSGKPWHASDVFTHDYVPSKYSFFEIGRRYIESIKHKSGFTCLTWQSRLNKFRQYVKNTSLRLSKEK